MADHYTLIGSTAREIEGGTVLIGGVLREIESGLVLVGGVAREIEFGEPVETVLVTITGSGRSYASVTIDGKTYNSAANVEVPIGTEVILAVHGSNSGVSSYIYVDNKSVASVREGTKTYTITVNGDLAVTLSVNTSLGTGTVRATTSV